MAERTDDEKEAIKAFLEPHFGIGFVPGEPSNRERQIINDVMTFVAARFAGMRYVVGMAADLTLLAQQLALHDAEGKAFRPRLTRDEIFTRYELVKKVGSREANTLTLKYGKTKVGIRKLEEALIDFFGEVGRPGYPSSYVYMTGQWQKFTDPLLIPCFRLGESARFALCSKLLDYAMDNLTEGTLLGRAKPRVRLFEEIIHHYPRSNPNENSGAVFQGIAYGYIKSDRPHLSLIVDKVRTGSARQHRIGDIDGYHGLDLELTVEVKDHPLTEENVTKEMGEFLDKVAKNKVLGLAFVASADQHAVDEMKKHGVACVTEGNALWELTHWDWRKQDAGVHGLLHYLAHVEQNPDAVVRLLTFIREKDSSHDALAYFGTPSAPQ
jgi:hypothetical protein